MKLINYTLSVQKKELLKDVNLEFEKGVVNHVLGSNGVGKSCFAKSLLGVYKYHGIIECSSYPTVIGSYTNTPSDLTTKDIVKYLRGKHGNSQVEQFIKLLKLKESIDFKLCVKKLSDGQKQKIKLMCFLIDEPKLIVLDEFTSSLDKQSTFEIYEFLEKYVLRKNVTCINITHNLSDIEYLTGRYFHFINRNILEINSKEKIINNYIKGEV